MRLVEVGCSKGFFFEMLLADGFDVTGFDPTYEGSNFRIVKEYFRPVSASHQRALILRHVLEHVPTPMISVPIARCQWWQWSDLYRGAVFRLDL